MPSCCLRLLLEARLQQYPQDGESLPLPCTVMHPPRTLTTAPSLTPRNESLSQGLKPCNDMSFVAQSAKAKKGLAVVNTKFSVATKVR